MIIRWQCLDCKRIYSSNSIETHHLDMCFCGKSGMDVEKDYRRHIGNVKIVDIIEDEK